MNRFLPSSFHRGSLGGGLLLAIAGLATVSAPTTVDARSDGAYYRAELAQPASERTVIAGGLAWACEGTSCTASKGTSRPVRICRQLYRDVGQIVSFSVAGEALDADKLAKCNG